MVLVLDLSAKLGNLLVLGDFSVDLGLAHRQFLVGLVLALLLGVHLNLGVGMGLALSDIGVGFRLGSRCTDRPTGGPK